MLKWQAYKEKLRVLPLNPLECGVLNYSWHPDTGSKVILTTAHLCRCARKCGELSHLRLLGQRCHLTLDVELHAQQAAERLRRESEARGQLRLWA